MYTSVSNGRCNGQRITYQQPDGRFVNIEVKEHGDCKIRMERKELTLSFHNLIKRGIYIQCFFHFI